MMDFHLEPGVYVIAVSGGVDSVTLLDLLVRSAQSSKLEAQSSFIVAHFDHGIRENSEDDRKFVEKLTETYGLPFKFTREELGRDASEAKARVRRYHFLNKIKEKYKADAIVTAHHKDDVLETAILNLLRGTGRKGLSSLSSSQLLRRPLLSYTKAEIINVAKANNLQWREDSTNADQSYKRNRVRFLLTNADEISKQEFLNILAKSKIFNQEIDQLLKEIFGYGYSNRTNSFSRSFFIKLPYAVSCELLAYWLRHNYHATFDKKAIGRLCVGLKTAQSGINLDIDKDLLFIVGSSQISVQRRSSV